MSATSSDMTHNSDSNLRVSAPSGFYTGGWYVDLTSDRIRRDDIERRLEARVMDVLVCLADRAGELVTREELEREVWAGTVVGYDALTSSITKLRKAFDDNPRKPHYIETVSKKGYRLIAPVSVSAPGGKSDARSLPTPGDRRSSIRVLAMIGMFAAILIGIAAFIHQATPETEPLELAAVDRNRPSVVVIPFRDISEETGNSYFSEGITEDLTTALSKLSGLFVISASSARNYDEPPLDSGQAAKVLGVRYVLTGSVRRSSNRLRISAQLMDEQSGVYLWAEQYDRTLQDVFEVQDDITAKIVSALSVKLTEEERRRDARRYTVSIDAYDAFLRGQSQFFRHTRENNLQARTLFQEAIDLDPGFSRAYSAMALTYTEEFRFGWNSDSNAALSLALALAKQAVLIDDTLPQPHLVLGRVYVYSREYVKAIAAARYAIELNPNYADSYAALAASYVYSGSPEAAIQLIRKAMRLNPVYPAAYAATLGQAKYFLAQYEAAVPALQDAIERNNNHVTSHVFLIAALSHLDRLEEAAWAETQLRSVLPEFNVDRLADMLPTETDEQLSDIVAQLRRAAS